MNKQGIQRVHFIGIGGIGMSALARYYQSRGVQVTGYDRTPSPLTAQLEKEGMAIHYEDNPNLLPALLDAAVYTPAVPQDLKELAELRRRGVPLRKRAEALGDLSKAHYTIAVAGTHGKTTTTAMVAHILHENGVDMTAFIGGIANNFDSNIHLGRTEEAVLVVEADEFDRSFLQLSPDISIVNAIDADHLDIYGNEQQVVSSFNDFAKLTRHCVISKETLPLNIGESVRHMRFGFDKENDFRAVDIRQHEGETDFNIESQDAVTPVHLKMAGIHNVLNATAAFAATLELGLEARGIAEALATFRGVKRRFDVRIKNASHCYIDDYAHHPEEIKSCLSAIKASFPSKRLTLVFQPHLFTRTRDFMEDFATTLAMADDLILLDIYPAREKPIEGISSQALLDKIHNPHKCLCPNERLLDLIDERKPELLVTMGAGSIDRFVEPLQTMISQW
ncbi:MAG: UDP-N-acetylmuramate--L-alanine ligase [Bacteroidales bacterium]|nr:UDP-N-acetylmuramate--L-alanine ligase [Bacteroidales bacterium]